MRCCHHKTFFSRATQKIIVVDDVSSPEDPTLRQSWVVQLIMLPQVHSTDKVIKRKGCNTFSCKELSNALLFGFNQVNPQADLTIILGSLDISGCPTPKLIMMRFHRMITSISNTTQAKALYHTLRCVSGNHGFELNHVSGSSGLRDGQSDQDFLMVVLVLSFLLFLDTKFCTRKDQRKQGSTELQFVLILSPRMQVVLLSTTVQWKNILFLGSSLTSKWLQLWFSWKWIRHGRKHVSLKYHLVHWGMNTAIS